MRKNSYCSQKPGLSCPESFEDQLWLHCLKATADRIKMNKDTSIRSFYLWHAYYVSDAVLSAVHELAYSAPTA